MPIIAELTGQPGFAPPPAAMTLRLRRRAAALQLVASIALTVSLIVAATAVSIGGARSLAPTAAPAGPAEAAGVAAERAAGR